MKNIFLTILLFLIVASVSAQSDTTIVSIEDNIVVNAVKVYPNPVISKLNVEGIYDKYEVINLTGRVVSREVSTLPRGIYYVRIRYKNSISIRKIILE
jgi:hypothetical protein